MSYRPNKRKGLSLEESGENYHFEAVDTGVRNPLNVRESSLYSFTFDFNS